MSGGGFSYSTLYIFPFNELHPTLVNILNTAFNFSNLCLSEVLFCIAELHCRL